MINNYKRFTKKLEYVKVVLYDGTYESEKEVYELFMKSNVVEVQYHNEPRFRELINKLIDILSCLHEGTYFVLYENGNFSAMDEPTFKNEGFICYDSLEEEDNVVYESFEVDDKFVKKVLGKTKSNKKKFEKRR